MSGVTTASAIGLGLAAVGTATQVAGALKGGSAAAGQGEQLQQRAAYQAAVAQKQAELEEYNAASLETDAQVSERNAVIAENRAVLAERAGERAGAVGVAKAEAQSQAGAIRNARVKASQAASGVDVNTGSAVDVRAGGQAMNKLDVETDLSNAALERYGYKLAADESRDTATMDRYSAARTRSQADVSRYRAAVTRAGGSFSLAEGSNAAAAGQAGQTAGYLRAAGTLAANASQLPLKWLSGLGSGSDSPAASVGPAGAQSIPISSY